MGVMQKERRLKLVYILPEFNPEIGSHFYHIYELLERAAESLDIFLVLEKAKTKPYVPALNGVWVQRFSWFPLRYLELWFLLLYLRLRGWKNFWVHYSLVAGLAALDVNSLLGGENFYWNCGLPWLYKRGWPKERLFRFTMRHSTLVTGTEGMKRMYMKEYGLEENMVKVMPNWINLERFGAWRGKKKEARDLLRIPQEKKVVLFVHHLSRRKGADKILPVLERLFDIPNLLFLVAGEGPEEKNLELGIRNQELGGIIRLEGEIPNREIPKYFAAADVFFMPSQEEGFPHVLLETMAAGIPFVASNVGGIPEIIPPELGQYLVEHGDVTAYSSRIRDLLLGDTTKISQQLQSHVKIYDLSKILESLLGLIRAAQIIAK